MKELKERMLAETPDFWKKVQKYAGIAGIVGAAIVAIPASVVALPAAVIGVGTFLLNWGTAIATMSQFTKK